MPSEFTPSPRIAIGAIMKNEAPYILEWVAYHRVLGVDRFFIADNGSDDGTSQLLAALHAIGVVTHIPFPDVPGKAPQLLAYRKIMQKYGSEADWFAFIDADEFLLPLDETQSLPAFLSGFAADVGAVVVNWALYGSSFHEEHTAGLVIERFTRRAKYDLSANHHYKSIVRTAAYSAPGDNPHHFRLRRGYRAVHVDAFPVTDHAKHGQGLGTEVHWHPLRINHYVVKSKAEFESRKLPRGRASVPNARRNPGFFRGHDRNEIEDPMPEWLVAATKSEMGVLSRKLH